MVYFFREALNVDMGWHPSWSSTRSKAGKHSFVQTRRCEEGLFGWPAQQVPGDSGDGTMGWRGWKLRLKWIIRCPQYITQPWQKHAKTWPQTYNVLQCHHQTSNKRVTSVLWPWTSTIHQNSLAYHHDPHLFLPCDDWGIDPNFQRNLKLIELLRKILIRSRQIILIRWNKAIWRWFTLLTIIYGARSLVEVVIKFTQIHHY